MPAPVGPIASGLFWWLLSRTTNPAQLENLIARIPLTRFSLVTIAKVLFGLGLTRYLSSEFSLYALNNYRSADTKRWDWPNEIAVVTGGCSGIGEEIVRALAKKGVKVAVLDMAPLPDRLKDVVAHHVKCDVTDAEGVHSAAEEIRSKLGSPSILVNNAGIGSDYPIFEIPAAKVKKLIEINLTSHWYTCHEFCPDMVKNNKGHVVELASMSSFVTVGIFSDYSAAKTALVSFTESLREQLRTWYRTPDVHVTIVHPHWVATPLVAYRQEAIEKTSGKMLTPAYVGGEIAKQIFRCRGTQLVLPGSLSFLRTTRAWPTWLLDGLKRSGGMSREELEKVM